MVNEIIGCPLLSYSVIVVANLLWLAKRLNHNLNYTETFGGDMAQGAKD
jgi:hypothetical protein